MVFFGELFFGDWWLAVFARDLGADDDFVLAQHGSRDAIEVEQGVFAGGVGGGDGGTALSGLEHDGGFGKRLAVERDDAGDAADVGVGGAAAADEVEQREARNSKHEARDKFKARNSKVAD